MKKFRRIMAFLLAFSCLLSATSFAAAAEEFTAVEQEETVVSDTPVSDEADADVADGLDEEPAADDADEQPAAEPVPVATPVATATPVEAAASAKKEDASEIEAIFAALSPAEIISVSAANAAAEDDEPVTTAVLELTSHPRDDESEDKLYKDSEFYIQLLVTAPEGVGALQATIQPADGLTIQAVELVDELKNSRDYNATMTLNMSTGGKSATFGLIIDQTLNFDEPTAVLNIKLKVEGTKVLNRDAKVGLSAVTMAKVGSTASGQVAERYNYVKVIEGLEYIYCECVLASDWKNWKSLTGQYTPLGMNQYSSGWYYNHLEDGTDAPCTNANSKIRICAICDKEYYGTAGHIYDDSTLIAKTAGASYYTCTRCHAMFSVDANGVQQTVGNTTDPRCGDLSGESELSNGASSLVGFVPQPDAPDAATMIYIYDVENRSVSFVGDGIVTKAFVDDQAKGLPSVLKQGGEDGVVSMLVFTGGEKGMSIEASAFKDLADEYRSQFDSLTIGFNVTTIGDSAFEGFNGLRHLTFDGTNNETVGATKSSLTSIGAKAFYNSQLTGTLTIPDSVTEIKSQAFDGSTVTKEQSGKSVTLDCYSKVMTLVLSGATEVAANAFANSTGLTTLKVGDGATLRSDSFYACTKLTTITTGDDVTIENGAFRCEVDGDNVSAPALESVTLGLNPTLGGGTNTHLTGAFAKAAALEEIYFLGGESLTITHDTFKDCANVDTIVIVGNKVTIEAGAFEGVGITAGGVTNGQNNKKLTVVIGAQLDDYGQYITDDEDNYVLATGDDCLFTIKTDAFKNSGLVNLTVGDNAVIEKNAFSACEKLASVTLGDGATLKEGAFNQTASTTTKLAVTIGSGATIEKDAFSASIGVSSITIGDDATIHGQACYGQKTLTSLTIGNGATIGSKAFVDCTALQTLKIGNNSYISAKIEAEDKVTVDLTENSQDGAFTGCTALETLVIGRNATIGGKTFKGSTKLTELVIGGYGAGIDDVGKGEESYIGQYAFEEAGAKAAALVVYIGVEFDENGEPVMQNGSYKMMDGDPYYRTNKIRDKDVTPFVSIYERAFQDSGVSDLRLGNVIKVFPYAFNGCSKLASINILNDAYICDAAFYRTGLDVDGGTRLVIGDRAVIGDGSLKDDETPVVEKKTVTQDEKHLVAKGVKATKQNDPLNHEYLFELDDTGTETYYASGKVYNLSLGSLTKYPPEEIINVSNQNKQFRVDGELYNLTDLVTDYVVEMKESKTYSGDIYAKMQLADPDEPYDPLQLYIEDVISSSTANLISVDWDEATDTFSKAADRKNIEGATKLSDGTYTKGGLIYAPFVVSGGARGSTTVPKTETEKKEVDVYYYHIDGKTYRDELDQWGNKTGNLVNIDPPYDVLVPVYDDYGNIIGYKPLGEDDDKMIDTPEPETTTVPKSEDVPMTKNVKGIEVPDPLDPSRTVIIEFDESGEHITGRVLDKETGKVLTDYEVTENEDGTYTVTVKVKPKAPEPTTHPTGGDEPGGDIFGVEVENPNPPPDTVIVEVDPETGDPTGDVYDPETGDLITPPPSVGKDDDGNYTLDDEPVTPAPSNQNGKTNTGYGVEIVDPRTGDTVIIETQENGDPTGDVYDQNGKKLDGVKGGKNESGYFLSVESGEDEEPKDVNVPDNNTIKGLEVPDPLDPSKTVIIEFGDNGEPTGNIYDKETGKLTDYIVIKNADGTYAAGVKVTDPTPTTSPANGVLVTDPETGDDVLIETDEEGNPTGKVLDPKTGEEVTPPKTGGKDEDGNYVIGGGSSAPDEKPTEQEVPNIVSGNIWVDEDGNEYVEADNGDLIAKEYPHTVYHPTGTPGEYQDDQGHKITVKQANEQETGDATVQVPKVPASYTNIYGVEASDPVNPDRTVIIEIDKATNEPTGNIYDKDTGVLMTDYYPIKNDDGTYSVGVKVTPKNPEPTDVPTGGGSGSTTGVVVTDPDTGEDVIIETDEDGEPTGRVIDPKTGEEFVPPKTAGRDEDGNYFLGDPDDNVDPQDPPPGDVTVPETEEKKIEGGNIWVDDEGNEYIEDEDGNLHNTQPPYDILTPDGEGGYTDSDGNDVQVEPKDKKGPVTHPVETDVVATDTVRGDLYYDPDTGIYYVYVADDDYFVSKTTPPKIYKPMDGLPGWYAWEEDPQNDFFEKDRDVIAVGETGSAEIPRVTEKKYEGTVYVDTETGIEYIMTDDEQTLVSRTAPARIYEYDMDSDCFINIEDNNDQIPYSRLEPKEEPKNGDVTVLEPKQTEPKSYKGDVYKDTKGNRYILDKETDLLVLTQVMQEDGELETVTGNDIKIYELNEAGDTYVNQLDPKDTIPVSDLTLVTDSSGTTGAFEGSNVGDVDIGDHSSIGDEAFKDTDNLGDVNVGSNTEGVGDGAFQGTGAGSIGFGDNTDGTETNFGDGAISDNENLTDVDLPEGTGSIGDGGLANNPNLKDIEIPESTDHLGQGVLDGNDSLENVTGGDNLGDLLEEGGGLGGGTGSGGLNIVVGANASNVTKQDVINFINAIKGIPMEDDSKVLVEPTVNGLTGDEALAAFKAMYPLDDDGNPKCDENGYPLYEKEVNTGKEDGEGNPVTKWVADISEDQAQIVAQWKADVAAQRVLEGIIENNKDDEDYVDTDEIPGYNDDEDDGGLTDEEQRALENNKKKEQEEKENQVKDNSKTVHYGDFDCNGTVNALDAVLVAQYTIKALRDPNLSAAGIDPTLATKAGDVNNNSKIDIMDAMVIAQYCVGLVRSLPIATADVDA